MSLIPLLFNDPTDWYRPTRLWDWDEDDFWSRPSYRSLVTLPNRWQQQLDREPEVTFDKDKFQVNVDVQQFSPNEVTVRTSGDNTIIVEGKHEERPDEHGYVSRQFTRRYVLPKGHDISQVASSLSSDGVLTITAPTVNPAIEQQRTIPVVRTGAPATKGVEKKE